MIGFRMIGLEIDQVRSDCVRNSWVRKKSG